MPTPVAIRLALRTLAALCVLAVLASTANAADLVMFRSAGCPWCAAWDREIGPIYPKTEIGKRLPLRMVDLDHGGDPTLRLRSPVRYTPTFVLIENGEEAGRIEGYPGDAFFWGLLEQLEKKLPAQSRSPPLPGSAHAGAAERIL